jgi:diguanylate cyclase (GGDEF)-like protein
MKVLAAEDNPVFHSMLRMMLTKWGYETIMARDGNEALRALESHDGPRLAILDWMMPGIDGVELCRRVRTAALEPYVYMVLLTARTESQDLIEGMESGADDYLTKPFHPNELRVRLRAGTRILQLQDQLVQAREALRVQATHDGLTGLLNRASILEVLSNELSRAEREQHPVSILLADIDRFKAINDTRGHHAGDAVLSEAARRMRSEMRCYDSVGRYGGEEFLIVLPGCHGMAARQQAERIVGTFSSAPFTAGDTQFPVTCSVGIAQREFPVESDSDALIREADAALYRAKHRGRNRVEAGSLPQLAVLA